GVRVLTGHKAKKFVKRGGKDWLIAEHESGEIEIEFDTLLVAVGRAANSRGFGLEEIGVRLNANGTIEVNEYLQSSIPTIYACGDVAGPYQFTHVGAHQAWYSSVNSLFGILRRFKADYSVIPWATFTEPEIARVGLSETEANEQRVAFEITRYDIGELDRAIADSEAQGFVKILTVPGKDRILGVTIVGEHAGDLIAEYVLAMRHGLGLNKILGTIHIYPTLAEANKYAAGVWKRAHAPERLLDWVAKFHRWRRKGR
ncbi:MAG TPA: FAD-dependent oxidoreductase, partial [Gammaproteobacteria bacterium]|nr:FAD-dependent oxidoreductase [Gammaproteobacteria bacterium]